MGNPAQARPSCRKGRRLTTALVVLVLVAMSTEVAAGATARPTVQVAVPSAVGSPAPPAPPSTGAAFGASPTPTRPPMQPQTTAQAGTAGAFLRTPLLSVQAPATRTNVSDTTECVSGSMTNASDFARLWGNRTAAWKGGDLGAATKLADGRIVWILGDNINGPVDSSGRWGPQYAPYGVFNRNGIAVQTGNCLRFLTASPGWIAAEPTAANELYWPFSVFESNGRLLALLGRYATVPGQTGLASFQFAATDLAELDPKTMQPIRIYRTALGRAWQTATVGPDGSIYLFGSWLPPGKTAFDGPSVYLARATNATIDDPSAWEFWHGAGWRTGDENVDTTPIASGAAGWPSAWYDRTASSWHLAYRPYEALGNQVLERTTSTADATSGWADAGSMPMSPPFGYDDGHPGWTYTALVQPQIQVDGAHLVFWSTNKLTPPGVDEINYPYLIGPEFVAWQPGTTARWGAATAFAPSMSPTRAAFLPGRVVALGGTDRAATANTYAMFFGQGRATVVGSVSGVISSADAQRSAYPVVRLYHALFLRAPDLDGYNFWVTIARGGKSLASIADSFATSPEFTKRYGNLTNSQFVTQLYRNVFERAPDAGGLAFWVGQLNAGKSRGSVVLSFSESAEYRLRFGPRTSIEIVYFSLLRRDPDPGGLALWSDQLQRGVPLSSVVASVMNSPEFVQQLFPGVTKP